jgi:chromosome segregation ATPase
LPISEEIKLIDEKISELWKQYSDLQAPLIKQDEKKKELQDKIDEHEKELKTLEEQINEQDCLLNAVNVKEKILQFFRSLNSSMSVEDAAKESKLPVDTCAKIVYMSMEDAYDTYLSDLFAEAASAFSRGASLEKVRKKTGLSARALKQIKKNPSAPLTGQAFLSFKNIAWFPNSKGDFD